MAGRNVVLVIVMLIGLTFSACGGKPTPDVQALETQTAAKIFATQTASVPTQTHTPEPTATPEPTPTPEPTATPEPTPTLTVTPVPCFIQSKEFLTQLQAFSVASTKPVSTTSEFVSQMQGLRRRLDATDVPSCAGALKVAASAFMDTYIDTLLAIMAGASDENVSGMSREGVALAYTLGQTWVELIMADASPEDKPARMREVEALMTALGAQPTAVATTVQKQVMAIVQVDALNIRERLLNMSSWGMIGAWP